MAIFQTLTSSLVFLSVFLSPSFAWNVKPFEVNIPANEIAHAEQLARLTRLPGPTEFQGADWDYGIPLDHLTSLRDEWLNNYNWTAEQARLNSYKQFTVEIEGLDIHFVHEKSASPNAIPLIMLHGWPGSFHEWLPTVHNLTSTQKNITFNVVIPSLPGYTFSSAPPVHWTVADNARVFNTLMTEVLGYKHYIAFGSDWGSSHAWLLYQTYPESVRAAHFAFIPFFPPTLAEIEAANVTLDAFGQEAFQIGAAWTANGSAYLSEQTHKPNTIGLALLDNPIGQFSWIAQLFHDWSDPAAGTGPSTLDSTTTITAILLYVYTRTFLSSAWLYSQNGFFTYDGVNVTTDAPMGYSAFKYNPGYWPQQWVAKVGNLVFYNEHDFGGHFPGLDNPAALVEDLRQIGGYYKV